MKKIQALILAVILIITVTIPVYADVGDGNITGGSGNMGDGSGSSYWNPGNDGVRVTVVDALTGNPVSASIDFSRYNQSSNIIHFGKNCKTDYINGETLSPVTNTPYTYKLLSDTMPIIVASGSGGNDIDAIKDYFCSEYLATSVSELTGIDYDELISGKYKLLIEPLAYFVYFGNTYVFSATEAALYDELVSGQLYTYMHSLTHKNLPLAIFLEYSDLGYSSWTGSTTAEASNANIISSLGIGIVTYNDYPINGDIDANDYEYRANTEVITSIVLYTDSDITPSNPANVTFSINGTNYNINDIVIPAGESQIVWVKWTTPSTVQTIPINVTVSGAFTNSTSFNAEIIDINDNIPPDPQASDTEPTGFDLLGLPNNTEKTSASWGIWNYGYSLSYFWQSDWQWHEENGGYWSDHGEYVSEIVGQYNYTSYTASISANMVISPDDIVPTANGNEMKSGYGISQTVTSNVVTNAPSSYYTESQTAISYFPEFEYNTYSRLLELTSFTTSSIFEFKVNQYSTLSRRVHFTPIWFPDNEKYTVYTYVIDAWTPAGMLSLNLSDYVDINGNMFDDWYTNRK